MVVLCDLDSDLSETCYPNLAMHPDLYPVRSLNEEAACLGAHTHTNTHIYEDHVNNT